MKWQNNISYPKSVNFTQMFSNENYIIETQDTEHKETILFHQNFQEIHKSKNSSVNITII